MATIIKSGSYLPTNVWSNDALIQKYQLASDKTWIEQRTGIQSRHFVNDSENVVDLAQAAVENLLEGLDQDIKDQIRLVIVASMSSGLPTPSIACQIIVRLGFYQAWGFDLSGACAGFVMAMDVANNMIKSYDQGYSLVIGAESMSEILNMEDRGSAILFGDGAGAFLIKHDGQGLADYIADFHQVHQGWDAILADKTSQYKLTMRGREVFNFVNRQVVPSLATFIQDHGLTPDLLLCHQANRRLLDIFQQKLGLNSQQIPSNIDQVANLSAASIPVLFDQLVKNGTLNYQNNHSLILCGFGAGLSWGHLHFSL
ncbi:TPA: ketoacyl-ACP synthase III [Streptococcus suis]